MPSIIPQSRVARNARTEAGSASTSLAIFSAPVVIGQLTPNRELLYSQASVT
mgnify:CR=1